MEENKNIEQGQEAAGVTPNAESNQQQTETSSGPTPSTPNLNSSNEMEVHHHGHVHETINIFDVNNYHLSS